MSGYETQKGAGIITSSFGFKLSVFKAISNAAVPLETATPYFLLLNFENSFSKNYNGFFLVDLLSCFNDVEQLESIQFEIYEIPVLVDYLKRSHRYYISKRFPEIEQTVENIKNQEPTLLVSFLDRFVRQYKEDLINHFEIEEKILFPYALKLYNYYHFEDKRNKQYLIE